MRKWIFNKWQLVFWSLFALSFGGAFIYLYYPQYAGISILFLYVFPSNTFFAIPHEPAVIFYGKQFGALFTTLVALFPTVLGCMVDYQVLSPIFRRTRFKRMKQTRIYLRTVRYFQKAPFLTISGLAISPLPFYPARILSIASGYPMGKYILAVLVGRLPRYFLLALSGSLMNIPNWVIGAFFVVFIGITIFKLWFGPTEPAELGEELLTSSMDSNISGKTVASELVKD